MPCNLAANSHEIITQQKRRFAPFPSIIVNNPEHSIKIVSMSRIIRLCVMYTDVRKRPLYSSSST